MAGKRQEKECRASAGLLGSTSALDQDRSIIGVPTLGKSEGKDEENTNEPREKNESKNWIFRRDDVNLSFHG